jgi:hypothetical protein
MKLTRKEREEFERWGRAALHGLDQSQVFVGILDHGPRDAARLEFMLQLASAILDNKSIVISVPFGVEMPPKLQAVADRIVRYNADDPATLPPNLAMALTELGINRQ